MVSTVAKQMPCKSLRVKKYCSFGRDSTGVKVSRCKGGGHKQFYRKVDFWRKKLFCRGSVRSIEYDPNRTAFISLIYYSDGTKSYILSPKGIEKGRVIERGLSVQVVCGNAIPLLNIPLGTNVHNVEFYPGSGGKIARSAGTVVQLIARENGYATLFIPSGEIRQVAQNCWATIGQVGNVEHSNKKRGKAGRSRWLGRRPKVRGSAINPVDHPHGGGEGRCPIGHKKPLTLWGKSRLGVKTRCPRKYSDNFILRR
jgi:large subunit ribosomal protein L2